MHWDHPRQTLPQHNIPYSYTPYTSKNILKEPNKKLLSTSPTKNIINRAKKTYNTVLNDNMQESKDKVWSTGLEHNINMQTQLT